MIPLFNTNYMKLRSSIASHKTNSLSDVAFSTSDNLITLKGKFVVQFYAIISIKGSNKEISGLFEPDSWLGPDGKPLMSGWSYQQIEDFYQKLVSDYLSMYNISVKMSRIFGEKNLFRVAHEVDGPLRLINERIASKLNNWNPFEFKFHFDEITAPASLVSKEVWFTTITLETKPYITDQVAIVPIRIVPDHYITYENTIEREGRKIKSETNEYVEFYVRRPLDTLSKNMDIFDMGNFLHPDEPVHFGDIGYRVPKIKRVKCNFSLLGAMPIISGIANA